MDPALRTAALLVISVISLLAAPARAEVVNLICEGPQGTDNLETYQVDLGGGTISLTKGDHGAHPYGPVRAEISDKSIVWEANVGLGAFKRSIDRISGREYFWNAPRQTWDMSAFNCHAAKRAF
jgi:hypothetical protein